MRSVLQTCSQSCRAERIPLKCWVSHARLQWKDWPEHKSLLVGLSNAGQLLHQGRYSCACVAAQTTDTALGGSASTDAGSRAALLVQQPPPSVSSTTSVQEQQPGSYWGTEAHTLCTVDACWRPPGYSQAMCS